MGECRIKEGHAQWVCNVCAAGGKAILRSGGYEEVQQGVYNEKITEMDWYCVWGLIGLVLLTGVALYPIGMKKLTRSYPSLLVETVNIPAGPDTIARGKYVSVI